MISIGDVRALMYDPIDVASAPLLLNDVGDRGYEDARRSPRDVLL